MIRLAGLTKKFGERFAVRSLDLDVPRGEVFGLLGPNGAGKTTTLSLMMGLLEPDAGVVDIAESGPPTDVGVRRKMGLAPQALALYQELTGRENLRFFGRIQGLSGTQLDERVDHGLEFVGLTPRANDLVAQYSGGMQRRLNLAAAILHEPQVLLLDEPTVGVDPQSRNHIFDNIEALKAQGRTIVYSTHYMEEAERLCDRVGILDQGELLALGGVNELIEAHGGLGVLTITTEAGEVRSIETENPVIALADWNRSELETVRSFEMERPGLERVFLNLTGRTLRDT
ncbi:MAG: ABC transporter ATP-binding protein [Thermoanaerobaculia bacterium]|nr:ABC transporter ATP-binding protein [Thermoanaerobaculia bacterium]